MVKQVQVEDIIPIRHCVLRKNKPIEDCYFTGDHHIDTYHLGVFLLNKLAGICTLVQNQKEINNFNFTHQLRGMAILPEYQGKYLGKELLDFLPDFLKQKNIAKVWCNARIHAVPFYQKNGYTCIKKPFDIQYIGMHQLMYKRYE